MDYDILVELFEILIASVVIYSLDLGMLLSEETGVLCTPFCNEEKDS